MMAIVNPSLKNYLSSAVMVLSSQLIKIEMSEKTSAAQKAGQKPSTTKPLTTVEVSQKRKPLIIKVNPPKVKILTGKVRRIRSGLIKALTIPKNTTATRAAQKLVMKKPGTNDGIMYKTSAFKTQRSKIPNM